jgi:hypothetical protein
MSSKRQLVFDDVVLKAIFLLEEEDGENEALVARLKDKVLWATFSYNTLHLGFSDNKKVTITKYDEYFKLGSSLDSLYEIDENYDTKMSIDRIYYYLNRIMNL